MKFKRESEPITAASIGFGFFVACGCTAALIALVVTLPLCLVAAYFGIPPPGLWPVVPLALACILVVGVTFTCWLLVRKYEYVTSGSLTYIQKIRSTAGLLFLDRMILPFMIILSLAGALAAIFIRLPMNLVTITLLLGVLSLAGTGLLGLWFGTGMLRTPWDKEKAKAKPIERAPDEDDIIYEWEVERISMTSMTPTPSTESCSCSLGISRSRLTALRAKNKAGFFRTNLREMVVGSPLDEITNLCVKLKEIDGRKTHSDYEQINNVLAFVHQFRFVSDATSTSRLLNVTIEDYGRYPLETLHDKEGDSDCLSILLASLLYRMGYKVVVLEVDKDPRDANLHYAVGVQVDEHAVGLGSGLGFWQDESGKRYYYCETTEKARHVGEMPEELKGAVIRPLFSHD